MPDDWEHFHNFNPNDGSDATENPDGDSYNNLDEFWHDTNPYDSGNGNVGIPAAPASVIVINNFDGSRDIYWHDDSDNETGFVIRDQLPNGSTVELGRVGPGQTHFHISAP
jgi:hypothetical protein